VEKGYRILKNYEVYEEQATQKNLETGEA